jgi:hypothetical protein
MKSTITPQEQFSKVANQAPRRSVFNRSHGLKTAFDAGLLIPIYVDEALPGDTFNMNVSMFGRLATALRPIMDNITVDVHFFSVPERLLWDNFKRMHGEQDNPTDTTDYTVPTKTATATTGYTEGSIFDYFGLPTKVAGYEHNTLFLRAYNKIFNDHYRDENLQNSVVERKTDSGDIDADFSILPRGKRKDYFTSCLPWAQKADPVTIPLGTSAPVAHATGTGDFGFLDAGDGNYYKMRTDLALLTGNTTLSSAGNSLYADLSTATAATITAWRQAFQMQSLFEKDARGGTRYIELILSHFGVRSPDARLQRSEYLGGFSQNVSVNPIANTSEDATNKQGDLAGIGTVGGSGRGFVKTFTEHEKIIGIASIRADLTYQEGLNRMWSRSTRFDYYYPALANIGEQGVLNKEIFIQNTSADDDVFGYQERYSEYKYKPSQVTSIFRSNHSTSLDQWHLAQEFGSLPSLNASFIEENPPIDRTIAVPSEPHMIMDFYFDLKCARPMPIHNLPASFTRI